jgi:signal transduction histidine kinase
MAGAWLSRPDDTGGMLRTVNWVARSLGYAWIGVLTFVLLPPRGTLAVPFQVAGYALIGLSMLAWALVDSYPPAARYRSPALAMICGVMAVAAGFGCAAGRGGFSMVVFGFVATLGAAGETSLTAALAVTAAGVLAIEIGGLAHGASVGTLAGGPAVVVAGLVIGRNRGAYRIQAEQSAALLAQREQLDAQRRQVDLLDERARIAREIHDVLAHSLGALGIQIQAARAVLADHGDIDQADELLAGAQQMAAEGLVETRRAVHALRTDAPPLEAELARASENHARRYHVQTRFGTGGEPGPLPPETTVALLRIASEALVNAAKHAAGQAIAVRLDYGDTDVRLTVRNDLDAGTAGDGEAVPGKRPAGSKLSTADSGYGLTGMAERLRLLDGTLQVGPDGGQWVVTAAVPRRPAGPAGRLAGPTGLRDQGPNAGKRDQGPGAGKMAP